MLVGRDFGIWFFPSTDSPMRMICSDRSSLNRLRADYTIGKKKIHVCISLWPLVIIRGWKNWICRHQPMWVFFSSSITKILGDFNFRLRC
jgi:hypothetical protein